MLEDIIQRLTKDAVKRRKARQESIASIMSLPSLMAGSAAINSGALPAAVNGGASPVKAGGNLDAWINQAMGVLGKNLDPQRRAALVTLIKRESSGNPRAINNWDSNAKRGDPSRGLMQTIGATFNRYKLPGHDDIYDPVSNIIAGMRYINSRYGDIMNVPSVKSGRGGY